MSSCLTFIPQYHSYTSEYHGNTLIKRGQASKGGGSREERRKERHEKIQQYHEYCDWIYIFHQGLLIMIFWGFKPVGIVP